MACISTTPLKKNNFKLYKFEQRLHDWIGYITVGCSHIQVESLFLLSEICELINAVFLINQNHTFESNG